MFKKILFYSLIFSLLWPLSASAVEGKNTYPKLANYFLKWTIEDYEVEELSKWDLLILDMEVQENSRRNVERIRELNPDIIIIAYITSQEVIGDIYKNQWQQYANLRKRLVDNIDESWWLKDKAGNKISFWPGTYMLNITDGSGVSALGYRWNEYLPYFVSTQIMPSGLWDGVFYDNLWGDVGWVRNGDMDVDRDGKIKSVSEINRKWAEGNLKMLKTTREYIGNDYIVLGNGMTYMGYQPHLNGMMFEAFPSPWENGGTWSGSMESYSKIKDLNKSPKTTVINSYYKDRNNFQKMRYGLTSTMLNDSGYYSFDYDNTSHGQLWWYDEYDVNLGEALLPSFNVLNKESTKYQSSLWRRDFENGIVLVNSSNKEQPYVFSREEFEKINGAQDRSVNNGAKINYIKLPANDGVVLLKRKTEIQNNAFYNGHFLRVYDVGGKQTMNGFFSSLENFPGNVQVLSVDYDSDGGEEIITSYKGVINIYKQGSKIKSYYPYGDKFKGEVALVVSDLDGDGQMEIITGAGKGGGPHIKIVNKDLKLIAQFFAFEKTFSGGVTLAAGDTTGDNQKELIIGRGAGAKPEVKIFDRSGKELKSFMAYDVRFKGGVSVAIDDVNNDGLREIVTGAGAGGGPEIRVFKTDGSLISKFYAYDKTYRQGVKVIIDDINDDGQKEILASIASF